MSLLIKICGLRTQADLDAAAGLAHGSAPGTRFGPQSGADFCGFIFHPASPRAITPEEAGELDSHAMKRVGVIVDPDERAAAEAACRARLDFLQLHGGQSQESARRVRAMAEDGAGRAIGIIRVLWPERYADAAALAADMARHAPDADLLLLDAGASGGGSGRRIAPERLAGLHSPRPWILAGGLAPDNVMEILAHPGLDPAGVDLNSGLEDRPGRKDPAAIRAALRALRTCNHLNPQSASPAR